MLQEIMSLLKDNKSGTKNIKQLRSADIPVGYLFNTRYSAYTDLNWGNIKTDKELSEV